MAARRSDAHMRRLGADAERHPHPGAAGIQVAEKPLSSSPIQSRRVIEVDCGRAGMITVRSTADHGITVVCCRTPPVTNAYIRADVRFNTLREQSKRRSAGPPCLPRQEKLKSEPNGYFRMVRPCQLCSGNGRDASVRKIPLKTGYSVRVRRRANNASAERLNGVSKHVRPNWIFYGLRAKRDARHQG